jgi:hypothetical protein
MDQSNPNNNSVFVFNNIAQWTESKYYSFETCIPQGEGCYYVNQLVPRARISLPRLVAARFWTKEIR